MKFENQESNVSYNYFKGEPRSFSDNRHTRDTFQILNSIDHHQIDNFPSQDSNFSVPQTSINSGFSEQPQITQFDDIPYLLIPPKQQQLYPSQKNSNFVSPQFIKIEPVLISDRSAEDQYTKGLKTSNNDSQSEETTSFIYGTFKSPVIAPLGLKSNDFQQNTTINLKEFHKTILDGIYSKTKEVSDIIQKVNSIERKKDFTFQDDNLDSQRNYNSSFTNNIPKSFSNQLNNINNNNFNNYRSIVAETSDQNPFGRDQSTDIEHSNSHSFQNQSVFNYQSPINLQNQPITLLESSPYQIKNNSPSSPHSITPKEKFNGIQDQISMFQRQNRNKENFTNPYSYFDSQLQGQEENQKSEEESYSKGFYNQSTSLSNISQNQISKYLQADAPCSLTPTQIRLLSQNKSIYTVEGIIQQHKQSISPERRDTKINQKSQQPYYEPSKYDNIKPVTLNTESDEIQVIPSKQDSIEAKKQREQTEEESIFFSLPKQKGTNPPTKVLNILKDFQSAEFNAINDIQSDLLLPVTSSTGARIPPQKKILQQSLKQKINEPTTINSDFDNLRMSMIQQKQLLFTNKKYFAVSGNTSSNTAQSSNSTTPSNFLALNTNNFQSRDKENRLIEKENEKNQRRKVGIQTYRDVMDGKIKQQVNQKLNRDIKINTVRGPPKEQNIKSLINLPQKPSIFKSQHPNIVLNEKESWNLKYFYDEQFPETLKSIGNDDYSNINWQRISTQVAQTHPYSIYTHRQDISINMGKINNNYVASCILAFSEKPSLMENIFCKNLGINKEGKYSLQVYEHGKSKRETIDDGLPFVFKEEHEPFFIHSDDKSDLFVPLIEKAWAKKCGSYQNTLKGTVQEFLTYFTGAPTRTLFFDRQSASPSEELLLWGYLQKSLEIKGNIIVCKSLNRDYGISDGGHCCVVGFEENEMMEKFVQIRRPIYTNQNIHSIQQQLKEGVFILTFDDFLDVFVEFHINQFSDSFTYSSLQTTANIETVGYYGVEIVQKGEYYFSIYQESGFNQKNHYDTGIALHEGRGELFNEVSLILLQENQPVPVITIKGKSRELTSYQYIDETVELDPGNYNLLVETSSKNQFPLTIGVFGVRPINIIENDRLYQDQVLLQNIDWQVHNG